VHRENQGVFCVNKRQLSPKTNFTLYREDVLLEIALQLPICKEIPFKFQYQHTSIHVLADFWHGAPKLYAVKHADAVTSGLKKEIKKEEWEFHYTSEHSVYSILVYILFYVMAANGTCQLHRYIIQEHKIHT
jgi:hypothetical protein